jgi:gliding motility-associated-like protein
LKYKNGYIYICGEFTGSNIDFDPSAATTALTASGQSDAFIAKYDTACNIQFAKNFGGSDFEYCRDIILDNLNNIYVTGSTWSVNMNFTPTASANIVTSPGGGGNEDIYMAKYSNAGQYIWGILMGGPGDDAGTRLDIVDNKLYTTGYFSNTVDFDPSAAVSNLTSAGNTDIYTCAYDLQGNYICGFGIGGATQDQGWGITNDDSGQIYLTGQFSGNNVDFDPGTGQLLLSANGSNTDVFLAKYRSSGQGKISLTGDTICQGQQAYLTYFDTGATGPFTVTYSDGQTQHTVTNVQNGVAFPITPNPAISTTYTIPSGSNLCIQSPSVSATVIIKPLPANNAGNDTSICPSKPYRLQGSGNGSYSWYPSTGMTNATTDTPTVTINSNTTFYQVIKGINNCSDTDAVNISVIPMPMISVDPLKKICLNDTTGLSASGGDRYLWSPGNFISNDTIPDPNVWPQQSTNYTVKITELKCGRDTNITVLVTVNQSPGVKITNVYDLDCGRKYGQLFASGAVSYQWTPANTLDNSNAADPKSYASANTIYNVTGIDSNGCKSTDSAEVKVYNSGTGHLFVPTAFTPNKDGKNDCFRVIMPGNVSDYELMVFDRWGTRMFITNNINGCWDGTYNNSLVQMGTYYYYYKGISSECGELMGKGDVQLVR